MQGSNEGGEHDEVVANDRSRAAEMRASVGSEGICATHD